MDHKTLKTAAESIKLPSDAKYRIIQNCKKEIIRNMEEPIVKHNLSFFRKPAAVLTALVLCLSLSVTALAGGPLKGFFRDITDYRGAIVGTSYEQATEEITLSAAASEDTLSATVTFVNPHAFPYRETQQLRIAAYQIFDAEGHLVTEGTHTDASNVIAGQATIAIPLSGMESGSYKLLVTTFTSEKKADQPLNLNGTWECVFEK